MLLCACVLLCVCDRDSSNSSPPPTDSMPVATVEVHASLKLAPERTQKRKDTLKTATSLNQKRAEYGFGEYGFKHRTQSKEYVLMVHFAMIRFDGASGACQEID